MKRQCDENFMHIDYLKEKKLLDCTAFAISSEVGEQLLLSFSNIFNFYSKYKIKNLKYKSITLHYFCIQQNILSCLLNKNVIPF